MLLLTLEVRTSSLPSVLMTHFSPPTSLGFDRPMEAIRESRNCLVQYQGWQLLAAHRSCCHHLRTFPAVASHLDQPCSSMGLPCWRCLHLRELPMAPWRHPSSLLFGTVDLHG